ncbi:MAG: hypothetical protein US83_C0011G0013 [Candidatus Falkowbacteria bacterium GW2011_GWC2_38_22]|uniref:Uncharacterized protein n=1 Tax=Candidatus Falkowbacteria bacterium GW2011_GWE1_38_31 TaxID=1618638 RepID=A0A0G0K2X3_9BACT|nr:MAG: hypothetical protein US73_C0009G0013 [Candidatus Falkowbacteria bacterium GW2011_GWF2_38_1205]KKQ60895.1 MAG: hypothetical protein US83_C0011G0013 [Candidatus Falkowbacteria bacterium GW2011_GWC2_38_22]KKQ63013.1 MAG: hypothetical protein US84_C0009G0013 [Candidatus Falkowbacteria bacterium GW2011_GWF1_38_22]KKQ65035.1 MAG: hypothetical protein US87_C0009G0013 [Candidatus Falkowbacteria bacterium GW2011_GWE2_38_254]KKQ69810.1 MAG: hypothetical protein US91_C0009G0013 [Candidatus Falkowb
MKANTELSFTEYSTKAKETLERFINTEDFGPLKTINSEMQNFCSVVAGLKYLYPDIVENSQVMWLQNFMEVFYLRLGSKQNPPRTKRIKNIIKILIQVFDNFSKNRLIMPGSFYDIYEELRKY